MPTNVLRNARKLAGFSWQAGPLLWKRIQEDRRREVEAAPLTPRFAEWPKEGIHAAWIGHSTVLLSLDGFTILTDPVLGERIGVEIGPVTVGMKRLVQPAIGAGLPVPDLILLSHAHMDHLDKRSLRGLENRRTRVVTASGTSDLLRAKRYGGVQELKWDESCQAGPVKIRAFEVKHWGARTQTDTHRGYNGYVLEAGRHRVVFGGDTAFTDTFRRVRTSKPVNLAIMPIGAYDPWIHAHCNPEQALTMAGDAGAEFVLPVHHRTFKLSSEPYGEPMERMLAAARGAEDRIVAREIGAEFHWNAA